MKDDLIYMEFKPLVSQGQDSLCKWSAVIDISGEAATGETCPTVIGHVSPFIVQNPTSRAHCLLQHAHRRNPLSTNKNGWKSRDHGGPIA